jgi:hypothetical protein
VKITADPRSDQWNADDFIGGPRTFTIAGVKVGAAEQKYDVELVEGQGRVWRPPLTMLRLLIAAWGDETKMWAGRRVTLYRDESIRFGSDAVGGVRVSHMSNLPNGKPFSVKVTKTRGRREIITVEPLTESPAPSLKSRVWDRSREIEPDLTDDERQNWIRGELADLGGDTPENLTTLLSNWEAK